MLKEIIFAIKMYIIRKEIKDMPAVYATLIIKGIRKFSSIPVTVKEKVKEILIACEMEELIDE